MRLKENKLMTPVIQSFRDNGDTSWNGWWGFNLPLYRKYVEKLLSEKLNIQGFEYQTW